MSEAQVDAVIKRVDLFGLPLDVGVDEPDVVEHMAAKPLLLTYLNPLAYKVTQREPEYAANLEKFDLVVCDGIGIQKAAKAVHRAHTPILTPDYSGIGRAYLEFGSSRNLALCLVGGKPGVAERAGEGIRSEYRGFESITSFGGYGDDPAVAQRHILEARPGMVLVGMGMGRQEAFVLQLAESGWQGIGICVGGFLDKLANPELAYPAWSEKIGLRFLGRLLKEPGRMSKRYFIDYQPFIGRYVKYTVTRR